MANATDAVVDLPAAAGHVAVRRLYLRLLAVVYACAFGSLLVQIDGLIGPHGIAPAADWLDAVRAQVGRERYLLAPTLCWLRADTPFVSGLCVGGLALSSLVFFEIAVVPALVLLWVFYLSLSVVGQDFLSFQWDALLLEAGFLSILLAPPTFGRSPAGAPVSAVPLWLLRLLTFRLMLSSGLVKLLSGDAAWRGLTALAVHYETQPLPNPMAWYAHQLPAWAHRFAALQMFGIELLVPFLIFVPRRRVRLAAAVALVSLQLAIAATGNYGIFNLLTIALCVPILDDSLLPARLRRDAPLGAGPRWPPPVLAVVAVLIGTLSATSLAITVGGGRALPRPLLVLHSWASPFRVVNGYGLFAVMTTTRPEIVVEGSEDGALWLPYEFRYKPGDVRRPPPFAAPHMPRLDWQMWFAALGDWRESPWFVGFEARLLEARPEVLALLARDPFEGRPPRYVRARLYRYRFTRLAEAAARGDWWTREEIGPFGPTLSR
jgi:hypothetical protein